MAIQMSPTRSKCRYCRYWGEEDCLTFMLQLTMTQVIFGFGLTALLTIAFSTPIMLVAGFNWLASHLAIKSRLNPAELQKWKRVLTQLILGLSDQQLLTGIAILIVGFTESCTISSFHFWVVFDLAWFSSVTHLVSLRTLQDYLSDHHRFRDLRVFLMLANYAMLLVAAILTFRNYDQRTHNCPVRCAFDHIRKRPNFPVSGTYLAQMILLTIGLIWALVPLYLKKSTSKMRKRLLEGPSGDVEAQPSTPKKIMLMIGAPPSFIVWTLLAIMWGLGVARLKKDRQWTRGEENRWGFGQVLPILLLVLPFFTVVEVLQGIDS